MAADDPLPFDPATYGRSFADVYDDWYRDISDVPATVAFLAALASPTRVLFGRPFG